MVKHQSSTFKNFFVCFNWYFLKEFVIPKNWASTFSRWFKKLESFTSKNLVIYVNVGILLKLLRWGSLSSNILQKLKVKVFNISIISKLVHFKGHSLNYVWCLDISQTCLYKVYLFINNHLPLKLSTFWWLKWGVTELMKTTPQENYERKKWALKKISGIFSFDTSL